MTTVLWRQQIRRCHSWSMIPKSLPTCLDAARLHPVAAPVGAAFAEFRSLILPAECVVCAASSGSLCDDCRTAVRAATVRPFRAEDGAESLPPWHGGASRQTGMGVDGILPGGSWVKGSTGFRPMPVMAAGHYRSEVSRLLLAYKDHGHTDVGRTLQAALAGALHAGVEAFLPGAPAARVMLVPVPTKSVSIRRRGYDPLGLLLKGLQRRGELPGGCLVGQAVVQRPAAGIRDVAARYASRSAAGQKGSGRGQLRANVRDTLSVRKGNRDTLGGAVCLVVDDVLTTGATIAEVTRVLRSAGAHVAGAVVIAATPPPSGTGDAPDPG